MGEFIVYANGKPQASHTTHEFQRFQVRDILLANMPQTLTVYMRSQDGL
jgi:hypothetical protein